MQLIESGRMRILIPDKGYKLVNKNNGIKSEKVYLGKNEAIENYTEIVDEKYINMDYVVELDQVKTTVEENQETTDMSIDLILLSIDALYVMFEPMLAMVPMTMSLNHDAIEEIDPMTNIYLAIVKRGLKDIEDIPDRFKENVRNLL